MLKAYGGHIAIGLDARDGFVSTEGWLETSSVRAEEPWPRALQMKVQKFLSSLTLRLTVCCQDLISTVQWSLARATGKQVIASGGVSSLADLEALASRASEGVSGAIVGKGSLYQPIYRG